MRTRILYTLEHSGYSFDVDAEEAPYTLSAAGELIPIAPEDEDPDTMGIWVPAFDPEELRRVRARIARERSRRRR